MSYDTDLKIFFTIEIFFKIFRGQNKKNNYY